MANFKPLSLILTLSTSLLLTGCVIAKPLTAAEEETKNELDVSNYYPATREMRTNIETQPLFAQAAFWGREYDLNPSDLESAIKLSAAVRKLGNAQRAVEIAQTTRALYPRDPYLTAEYAAGLIASERALNAIQPLDEALRIAPNYARLWSLKGAALDQTEQYELARRHYDRALRITPNDPNILANLGLNYALSGDPVTAEKWLRRASSQAGANPGVHQKLALVLQLQGKTNEAEKLIRLSRGDQKLPPPAVPAHNISANSTAQALAPKSAPPRLAKAQAPQNLRGSQAPSFTPQRQLRNSQSPTNPTFRSSSEAAQHAARKIQQHSKSAQPKPLPTTGELTDEQRALLNQIAGNLNPQQQALKQHTTPQKVQASSQGYPPQAYVPQNYHQPTLAGHKSHATTNNTTSRRPARRRR